MPSRFRIYPYGPSESARALMEALDGLLIRRERSRYGYRPNHLVINWGSAARPPILAQVPMLNNPEAVANATSKTRTYKILAEAGVPTLEVTTSNIIANDWNTRVVARELDRGSQGRGIKVYQKGERVGQAAFYTKYFRKEREFRVHVVRGQPIFIQEKVRKHVDRRGEGFNRYIRSHNMGWCFAFGHLSDNPCPRPVVDAAIRACQALGLDFGAVDLGWHDANGVCVFEVNTAPGIEQSSLQAYVTAFQKL